LVETAAAAGSKNVSVQNVATDSARTRFAPKRRQISPPLRFVQMYLIWGIQG
jgi:hypothetical protein